MLEHPGWEWPGEASVLHLPGQMDLLGPSSSLPGSPVAEPLGSWKLLV